MAIVKPSKPYTFIDGPGNTAVGAEVNDNFDTLYSKIGEVIDAINNAAGSKVNLDARLDVALNEDGTPRSAVTSGGEWINPGFTATYISATQFSVPGDQRDIYQAGRRVKVGLAASTVYSTVSASTHGAGITTVTVGSVLTNPISSVEHGIVTPDNGSSSLPTDFMTTAATGNKGVLRDASGEIAATAGTFQKAQTTWDTAAVKSINASNPSGKALLALQNLAAVGQLVLPAAGGRLEARNAADALIPVSGGNAANPEDFTTKAQVDATRPTSYMTAVDGDSVSTLRIVASQTIDVAAGDVVLIHINASLIKGPTQGDTLVYVVKSGGTANIHPNFNGRGIVYWNSMVEASGGRAVAMSGSVKAETSGTLGLAMYAQSSGSASSNNGCFMSAHVLR